MKLVAVANPDKIESVPSTSGRVTKLAKQLNMAFLVYRGLMSDELKKVDAPVESKSAAKALLEAEDRIKNYWSHTFSPNIKAGLKIHGLDNDTASVMAGKYAGKLAETINEVSDRAFIEGYNAALNKNWEKAVAWKRIADAYGLDPAQMRKWITYYPEDGYHPDEIPTKSKDLLDTLLGERGKRISENEAWTVKNIGKQAAWEKKIRSGKLPTGIKKVWRTAEDEMVCDVCGPLNGTVVSVENEYDVSEGMSFFVPPLHVNCRCDIELEEFEIVTKFDKYKRDKGGQFSSVESRGAKTPDTPFTRSNSITRTGQSQPTKVSAGQTKVVVQEREKKKPPYRSEMVIGTNLNKALNDFKVDEKQQKKLLVAARQNQKPLTKEQKAAKVNHQKAQNKIVHLLKEEQQGKEVQQELNFAVAEAVEAKKGVKEAKGLEQSMAVPAKGFEQLIGELGPTETGDTVDLGQIDPEALTHFKMGEESRWEHEDLLPTTFGWNEDIQLAAKDDEIIASKQYEAGHSVLQGTHSEYMDGITGSGVGVVVIASGSPVEMVDGQIVGFSGEYEIEKFVAEPGENLHRDTDVEWYDPNNDFNYSAITEQVNETDEAFTLTLLRPFGTD